MYYTSKRNDRIGMQIYAMISTINYCEINNYTYIHSPLPSPYEGIFNLGKNQKHINEKENGEKITNYGFFHNLLDDKTNFNNFSNSFRKSLIDKYNYKKNINQNTNYIKICIHVRRGDTIRHNNKPQLIERFCDDNYLKLILYKIHTLINKPVKIFIHSDSIINIDNFNTYNLDIKTCFDYTPMKSLNDMINCDILFRKGISAFSGICAIYNTNIVISDTPDKYKKLFLIDNIYDLNNCDNLLSNL